MNKKLRDEKEYLIATRRKRGSASQSDSSKSRQSGKARRTSSETGSQASSNANRICQNCGRTDSPESVPADLSFTRLELLTRWSADGEVDRTATRRSATPAACGGPSLKSRARAAAARRATVRSRRRRPRSLLSLRFPSLRRNRPGRQPRARRPNLSCPRPPRSRRTSRSTLLSDACTYVISVRTGRANTWLLLQSVRLSSILRCRSIARAWKSRCNKLNSVLRLRSATKSALAAA